MRLGIRSERRDAERRVAATPATVEALVDLGFGVLALHPINYC